MHRHLCYVLFFICFIVSSCQKTEPTTALLQSSQKQKPVVAIVPLIDNSDHTLGWNLSDEITYTLFSKLEHSPSFELTALTKTKNQIKKLQQHHNPFSKTLNWVKPHFPAEDFVVFLEMIEHNENPNLADDKATPSNASAQLNLMVRIRIVDLRTSSPTVVLQEILQNSHFIPRQFTRYHFHQASWNTEEFAISPVGIAHAQLIKEIKQRVEDYIVIASK